MSIGVVPFVVLRCLACPESLVGAIPHVALPWPRLTPFFTWGLLDLNALHVMTGAAPLSCQQCLPGDDWPFGIPLLCLPWSA
jgi:hypothetical protein